MSKQKQSLLQAAIEHWPEDEAYHTYKQWLSICENDSIEYADDWLAKQKAHMHKVFDDLADIARYDAELTRLQSSD